MGEAKEFLKWLLIILVGLWILWFFTGGPDRYVSKGGIYVAPPETPGDSWKPYGFWNSNSNSDPKKQLENLEKAQELAGISLYKDKVTLNSGNASDSDVDDEYLIIETSKDNSAKIDITGWILESVMTGRKVTIGKSSYLPYTSRINIQEPIFLSPGSKAYITTGRSPIGTSFRTNLCTGYFQQFQNFHPSLKEECPNPEDENDFITTGPNSFNDDCIDFVEDIPRCEINTGGFSPEISYECQNYIGSKINYNTCVDNHKNESGFYRNEWRVYLNRDYELWKSKRETIKLFDNNGKLVDTVTY